MKNLYLISYLLFQTINGYLIYPKFFNNDVSKKINLLLKNEVKNPIIIDGVKTPLKKDLCKIIAQQNYIPFCEYNFKDFILHLPHLINQESLIYVPDFLIDNGRILYQHEYEILKEMYPIKPLIVFESENIKTIPLKDTYLIKRFSIYDFPEISKKEINRYISDLISIFKYNDDLFLLNMTQYNIDKLNLEKIAMLIFELNNLYNENNNIDYVNNQINEIIESFV